MTVGGSTHLVRDRVYAESRRTLELYERTVRGLLLPCPLIRIVDGRNPDPLRPDDIDWRLRTAHTA